MPRYVMDVLLLLLATRAETFAIIGHTSSVAVASSSHGTAAKAANAADAANAAAAAVGSPSGAATSASASASVLHQVQVQLAGAVCESVGLWASKSSDVKKGTVAFSEYMQVALEVEVLVHALDHLLDGERKRGVLKILEAVKNATVKTRAVADGAGAAGEHAGKTAVVRLTKLEDDDLERKAEAFRQVKARAGMYIQALKFP